MDEIDAKLAICRWNLGQNSRWNLKLPFKINFGRWITIWKQSGRWISLLTLGFKFGHWVSTGVISAVRSRWRERGDFSPKITKKSAIKGILRRFIHKIVDLSPIADISTIYLRFFGDFWRKIAPPTYLLQMSFHSSPTRDISTIFRRYFPTFPPCLNPIPSVINILSIFLIFYCLHLEILILKF